MMTLRNATLWIGEVGDDFTHQTPVTLEWLRNKREKCLVCVIGYPVVFGHGEVEPVNIQAEWHPGFKSLLPVECMGNHSKRIHLIRDKVDGNVKVRFWFNPCRRKFADLIAQKTSDPRMAQSWLDAGEPVVMVTQDKNFIMRQEVSLLAIDEGIVVTQEGVFTYSIAQHRW